MGCGITLFRIMTMSFIGVGEVDRLESGCRINFPSGILPIYPWLSAPPSSSAPPDESNYQPSVTTTTSAGPARWGVLFACFVFFFCAWRLL